MDLSSMLREQHLRAESFVMSQSYKKHTHCSKWMLSIFSQIKLLYDHIIPFGLLLMLEKKGSVLLPLLVRTHKLSVSLIMLYLLHLLTCVRIKKISEYKSKEAAIAESSNTTGATELKSVHTKFDMVPRTQNHRMAMVGRDLKYHPDPTLPLARLLTASSG